MSRRRLTALTVLAWALSGGALHVQTQEPVSPAASYRPVIDKYCVSCHSEQLKTGSLALDTIDLAQVPAGAEVWETVESSAPA